MGHETNVSNNSFVKVVKYIYIYIYIYIYMYIYMWIYIYVSIYISRREKGVASSKNEFFPTSFQGNLF